MSLRTKGRLCFHNYCRYDIVSVTTRRLYEYVLYYNEIPGLPYLGPVENSICIAMLPSIARKIIIQHTYLLPKGLRWLAPPQPLVTIPRLRRWNNSTTSKNTELCLSTLSTPLHSLGRTLYRIQPHFAVTAFCVGSVRFLQQRAFHF